MPADLAAQGECALSNLATALGTQTMLLRYQVNNYQLLLHLPPFHPPFLFIHNDLLHMLTVSLSFKSGYEALSLYSYHHLFMFYALSDILISDSTLHVA